MNDLVKRRRKTTFKYTWPIYIVSAVIAIAGMNLAFKVAHPTPAYKVLTLFLTGELKNRKELTSYIMQKYEDKQIKSFSCIEAKLNDGNYYHKLTVLGYNSADVLIFPESKITNLKVSDFAIELEEGLINSYCKDYHLYQQDEVNYGIKLNKEKVADYMSLTNEDYYMVLNARSANIGKYSTKQIKEHDMALNVLTDWGM